MPLLSAGFVLILTKLCVAHLVSDYFLQFQSWVSDKGALKIRSPKLYAHIAVTFLAAGLFSGEWLVAAALAAAHYLIDLTKLYYGRKDSLSFILDQMTHFTTLIFASLWISDSWSISTNNLDVIQFPLGFWVVSAGYALISFPMSVVIGIVTHRFRKDLPYAYEQFETMYEAGKWIGILERVLILTFLLLNQFTAIGLLIFAKAIFKSRNSNQNHANYTLIGTLLSVSVTVAIGLLIRFLLQIYG